MIVVVEVRGGYTRCLMVVYIVLDIADIAVFIVIVVVEVSNAVTNYIIATKFVIEQPVMDVS